MNIISIDNLYKNIHDKNILKDINLNIKNGEFISILGHNGAGKTTLINTIMDLVDYSGTINYSFQKKDLYNKIAYQMQSVNFEKDAKVLEMCSLYKKIQKSTLDIGYLLEKFNLQNHKNSYIKELSGGQKQILSVILTILCDAPILIFDEISTGLDSIARRHLWDLLLELKNNKQKTIILTSHFLDEVEYLSDRVVIMDQGKIVKTGKIEKIIKDQFDDNKIMEFQLKNTEELKKAEISNYLISNNKVVIEYDESQEKVIYNKVKDLGADNITMRSNSFEDAFLKLLGYTIKKEGEIYRG